MEQIISKSYDEMVATYTRTLANFYPARGSTGFTEANQVHIYVNALIKCLDDDRVVSWLEFPWADKNSTLMDLSSHLSTNLFFSLRQNVCLTQRKNKKSYMT